jgi:hypothetical protein
MGKRCWIPLFGLILACVGICLPATASSITATVSGTLAAGPSYDFQTSGLSGTFDADGTTFAVSNWNLSAGGFSAPYFYTVNGFTFNPTDSTATGNAWGFQFTSNDSQYSLFLGLNSAFAASSTITLYGSFNTQAASGGLLPIYTSTSLNLNSGTLQTSAEAADATPEPASAALLATGALLLLGLAWRRRSYTGV